MRRTFLIASKEFKRYFDSPIAYITILVFLLISGWLFSSTLFLMDRASIQNFTANVPLLLLFLAPAVAMQLLAGEFNQGTMEVLGSLPVKDEEIIAGKFIAAFALMSLAIILTLIFPVTVSSLGNFDWGQGVGAYIGMILIGGAFLAAGLFASALTSSQVVAFILGFLFSFILFLLGKFSDILPSYIKPVAEFIGIDSHWENLSRGVIDLRNIVYFISLFALFIYGSLAAFSRRIRSVFQRAASLGLLACILILINLLLSGVVFRMDLTSNNIYSLSEPSKKIMRSLDDPVIVRAFFSEKLPGEYKESKNYLRDLLHEYRAYSKGRLNFSFIDPSESEEYAREAASYGIPPLQFTEAGRESYEVRQGYMGIAVLYGDRAESIPVLESVRGIEYDLSTRIKKLISEETAAVGYIGDPAIPDELASEVRERYRFIQISSTGAYNGNQFSSVILAGRGFSDKDIMLLTPAVERNIPLALLIDRYSADMDNFSVSEEDMEINGFLESYGLSIGDGLIADRQAQRIGVTTQQGFFRVQNVVNYPYFPLLTEFSDENPAVRDLDAAVFPFVSPLEISDEENRYEIEVLAETSGNSWLIRQPGNLSPMSPPRPGPDAAAGPFPVAAAVYGSGEEEFRMLLASNARFFQKDMLNMQSNRSLFNNIIDWLSEDADLIAIRSKGISARPLKEISGGKMRLIKNLNIFLIPVLLILFGLIRWKTRSKRRSLLMVKYLT